MANGLTSGLTFQPDDFLYRFLHRTWFNDDGTVNSAAFNLRSDPALSVGIAKLIAASSFDAFRSLMPRQGLVQISVRDAVSVDIGVLPERSEDWGVFADAHAVLTGYENWTNKRKLDAARALRNAANKGILCRPPT
jgi:hypothetical protein